MNKYNNRRDPWDDVLPQKDPIEEIEELKIVNKKIIAELEAIKNPPKKKSPLDGLTTYEKVVKVGGEVTIMFVVAYGILFLFYEFLTSRRGILVSTFFIAINLWAFFGLYDILAHHYDWKWKGKLKDF